MDHWHEDSGCDARQNNIKGGNRFVRANWIIIGGASKPFVSSCIGRVDKCAIQGRNYGAEDFWQDALDAIKRLLRWGILG
jgi:hypothetical protein